MVEILLFFEYEGEKGGAMIGTHFLSPFTPAVLHKIALETI